MATFSGKVDDRQILLFAAISIGSPPVNRTIPKSYKALLDTGAQGTLISEKVVNEIGLITIGPARFTPASGKPVETKKYRVRVDIPIESQVLEPEGGTAQEIDYRGMELEVSLLPYQPTGYDILLGMDFLSSFHFTMYAGTYILSS